MNSDLRDLSFPTRDEAVPPAVGAQSLTHWTTREVPRPLFIDRAFLSGETQKSSDLTLRLFVCLQNYNKSTLNFLFNLIMLFCFNQLKSINGAQCSIWKDRARSTCTMEKSPQLSAEKASHGTRCGTSPLVFQKVVPIYICAYRQVYKCTEKRLEQYITAVNVFLVCFKLGKNK